MHLYELEEALGGFTTEEYWGCMEKHHIIFRSQGGCDFYYNIIELPTGIHKGRRGPHMCRATDLLLKRDLRDTLFLEFGTSRKTAEEIVSLCRPMNRKSAQKLHKRLLQAKSYAGKYEPEDAIRAIMGGNLYWEGEGDV